MPKKKLAPQKQAEMKEDRVQSQDNQVQLQEEQMGAQGKQMQITNKENDMQDQGNIDKAAADKAAADKAAESGKTVPGYTVPESEKHLIHFELEDEQFDIKTGIKLSKPALLKEYPNEFKNHLDNREVLGLKITILYEPKAE